MRFLINVPETLHERLKQASRRRGQTLTGLIREILWAWVESETSEER